MAPITIKESIQITLARILGDISNSSSQELCTINHRTRTRIKTARTCWQRPRTRSLNILTPGRIRPLLSLRSMFPRLLLLHKLTHQLILTTNQASIGSFSSVREPLRWVIVRHTPLSPLVIRRVGLRIGYSRRITRQWVRVSWRVGAARTRFLSTVTRWHSMISRSRSVIIIHHRFLSPGVIHLNKRISSVVTKKA